MNIRNIILYSILSNFLLINPSFSEENIQIKDKKINILVNSAGENLFSSWFSGGDEIGAFINSEEEAKTLNIKSNEYNTFSFNNMYLHIPVRESLIDILKTNIKLEFMAKTKVLVCDINTFISSPEQKSDEIFDLALQRYKIKSPFTKSEVLNKNKYKILINDRIAGYVISPEETTTEELYNSLRDSENWEQKLTLAFDTSIFQKRYDLMMVTRNPNEGVKVQQTIKELSEKMNKKNTIKISFGDFFSTDRESEGRKLEIKNFIENSYDITAYANRDFRIPFEDITEIIKKTPIIATNIQDEKKSIKPYKILNIDNTNIGFLSFSENYYPKAKNYVNKNSKIKFLDNEEQLKENLKNLLTNQNVDLILVLSNIISSKDEIKDIRENITELINKYPEKQVIFISYDNTLRYVAKSRDYDKNFNYKSPNLLIELPIDSGIYTIELSLKDRFVSNLKIVSNIIDENKKLNSELKKIRKNVISEVQPFITNLGSKEVILPDYRDIKNYLAKNNLKNVEFEDDIAYKQESRAIIASNILLEKYFSEIAIVSNDYGNSGTIGEISKAFFDEWFLAPNSEIVFFSLYGKELKELYEKDQSIKIFNKKGILKFNGIDFKENLIRGRTIKNNELYKIVAPKTVFDNLLLQDILKNAQGIEIRSDLKFKDEVVKYLENLLNIYDVKNKKFTDSYYSDLIKLFDDKSQILSTKWDLSLKNIDFNYNRNQIFDNENYSGIKDTRVNNPNQSNFGFSGKFASSVDSRDITLINSLSSIYNQTMLEVNEKGIKNIVERKGQDDISLGNDLQLKFISLNLRDLKLSFIPYINATYSTEFKPTINQKTQQENNRRSELNSTGGLLFKPNFIDEFRIALLSRYDFTSKTSNSLNPGVFMSFLGNYDLFNNYSLILDGNFRYLLPQNNESPELLSTYGEINAKLLIPIFNRLKLSLNANAFIFRGNLQLREQNLGYGFNAFAGINYSFDTKPIFGIYF